MSGGVRKIAQVAVGAVIGFVQGGPVGAAIGAGLAFYMAEQQEKLNTKSPLRDNEPSAQTVRSSKAPARFILGRVSTGGVLVWAQEQAGDQADGEMLHLVYVLCEGPVDALENIYLGEEEIATYGEHASYELIVNPTQVNAFLKANCPDWKDEQIGRGLSFVRLSLKYSAEKFPSGIPDARFIVRGRNDVYDPRTGMAVYTENTALHILWFLRNRCGVPDDEIVFETFVSGANVCDESVVNPDNTTSPRYRSSCVIGADEQRTSVLQKLEAACGGRTIRVGGRWMFQAGAYYGPFDFEITEDMVVGTITGSTEPTNDAAINTVRGTFIDTAQSWTETDYPEVSVAEWVVEDRGEAAETLSFSYVTDAYQAQRLANIELRRRRAGGTISLPMNFLGYNCRPGRAVRVNLPSLNMLGEFIVTNWSMGANEGCTAQLQQYDAAQFDDAVGQPYNPIGFINLPAGGLGSPTGLAWSVDESAEVTQGVLSWVQPVGIVTAYAITVRQGATAVQAQQVPATTLQLPLSGLPSGSYTMSVAALGPLTRSGEASITVSIGGPPMPESCVVQSTIDTITLIPSNILHGINGGTYDYYFSTNPQATEGEYVGQGPSLTHTGLAFATNYAYFVRSKNAYGVSAFLKVVASTSTDVENMLEALKDKINSGQLAPVLREDIELITAPPTIPGSVNERVEGVRADLREQITEVSNHVTEVQNELKRQIDEVADLADSMPYKPGQAYTAGQGVLGDDGKLYQAKGNVPAGNPPPNAAYWTDVGQAVQTANGLAARVGTVETQVTELDGEIDAQAQQLDGLRTSVAGKADSTVVDSLSSRVTQNEQGLSSQGQAMTGLQNSLTTTNQNVTAAQQAAQSAADAAGAKGKVLYQSTAPAVADRLAQNLWIDTTGNANTPKRWSGTAWVAVTDKVATDAAAAAASALTQVATKADSSTVQALSNTVDQHGTAITANGQALINITTSLTQVGGENLLYNPSFEAGSGAVADGWFAQGNASGRTYSLVASTLDPAGKAQRIDCTGLTTSAYGEVTLIGQLRIKVNPGDTFTLSTHLRGTAGARFEIYIITLNSGLVSSGSKGAGGTLSDSWQRIAVTHTMPATAAYMTVYLRIVGTASVSSGYVEFDRAQLEQGSVMSGWRDNNGVSDAAIAANAAATSALTGRVSTTEQGIISASNQLTQLDNAIGDIGGENLLYNPSFVKINTSDAGFPDGWQREGAATNSPSMVVSWLNSGERAFRCALTGVTSTSPYLSLVPAPGRRPKVAAGQVVTSSIYARRTATSGLLSIRLWLQWLNAAGAVISSASSAMSAISVEGGRFSFSGTAPADAVEVLVYYRIHAPTSAAVNGTMELARPQVEYGSRVTGWRDNGQVNAANNAATSTAVDNLSSTVGQQGGTLTSVANRTTTLENAVNSTTNGLATKASASALDAVTNRVSAAEGVNTSQSYSITELNNNVGAIQGALGASGLDPAPNALWQFDSTVEGWSGTGATLTPGTGFVTVTSTGTDPQFVSPAALAVSGGLYTKIRVSITRRAGSGWDGQLFYTTAGHSFAAGYRKVIANPQLAVGASVVLEWDMANLTAGGSDWASSTIDRLRIDLGATAADVFDVDWVAVGRPSPSASSRAVSSLSSEVAQQGNTLTSQGQALTALGNRVTDAEGVNSAQASAISQIDTTVKSQGDSLTAQAQRLDGIYVQVNPEMEGDSTGLAGATGGLVGVWTVQSAVVEDGIATGKRIDTVQSQMGDVSASVQQVSQTIAGVDGRVSAMTTIKAETSVGGRKVLAGLALGSDGETSEILAFAQRFAIVDESSGQMVLPFVVSNGQVFINQAVINTAFIQQIVAGMTIRSQAVNAQGLPLLELNFVTGAVSIRGQDANGSTLLNNGGLYVYDASGVERTAVGRLT